MSKSYKYKRSRKPLTINEANLRLTDAIKAVEKIVLSSNDEHKIIQAANAMSGLIKSYKSLIETTELIERVEALEIKAEER